MDLFKVVFYLFALITLVASSFVVFSKNIVRSAFSLLFALFGVAGLYVLLLADFLAVTQLMIYVGGILVLIIFGVMLTHRQVSVDMKTGTLQIWPALIITAALAGSLVAISYSTEWKISPMVEAGPTAPKLGEMLLGGYLLPFEIASVVLLVALIGAAMIARRERKT